MVLLGVLRYKAGYVLVHGYSIATVSLILENKLFCGQKLSDNVLVRGAGEQSDQQNEQQCLTTIHFTAFILHSVLV